MPDHSRNPDLPHDRGVVGGVPAADARQPLEHSLQRILWELRPYLGDIVVIGGWVPYLYQRYGGFAAWSGHLSLTAEVDVLVPRELPPGDRPPIPTILESAGFTPTEATPQAAVWTNDPERGEKVEFLVPHVGTYQTLGKVVPIGAQRGMGAVALTALDVMQRHTRVLPVLARAPDGTQSPVDLRVPLLGAYVLNKAATFQNRRSLAAVPGAGVRTNPKKAKDLLYLRDLMHAGAEVVAAIERDIEAILEQDTEAQDVVDTAANNLDGTTRTASPDQVAVMGEAGAMLVEREPGTSHAAATANVTGHLTDLAGILLGFRSDSPPPETDD